MQGTRLLLVRFILYEKDQPARVSIVCLINVIARTTKLSCDVWCDAKRPAIEVGAVRIQVLGDHARELVQNERRVARFGALRSKIAWTKGLPENVDDGLGFMVRQRNVDIVQQILIEWEFRAWCLCEKCWNINELSFRAWWPFSSYKLKLRAWSLV